MNTDERRWIRMINGLDDLLLVTGRWSLVKIQYNCNIESQK